VGILKGSGNETTVSVWRVYDIVSVASQSTIVEDLAPGVYEVEFSDPTGHAYALVAVGREQLLELHHEPNDQLA
jgi:hypothetical protein